MDSNIDDDWTAKVIPDATIEDLDKEAIEKARKEFKNRNPKYAKEMESWDDEKFLLASGDFNHYESGENRQN